VVWRCAGRTCRNDDCCQYHSPFIHPSPHPSRCPFSDFPRMPFRPCACVAQACGCEAHHLAPIAHALCLPASSAYYGVFTVHPLWRLMQALVYRPWKPGLPYPRLAAVNNECHHRNAIVSQFQSSPLLPPPPPGMLQWDNPRSPQQQQQHHTLMTCVIKHHTHAFSASQYVLAATAAAAAMFAGFYPACHDIDGDGVTC
jgi:hypothetical protein